MGMMEKVLESVTSIQTKYDGNPVHPEKLEAKKRAAELVKQYREHTAVILDVGGEDFYKHFFKNLISFNLPQNDMHYMRDESWVDVVLAMHVLEHSSFPLLALENMKRVLKSGGVLYVSVPRCTEPFLSDPNHFSVLPVKMWRKLILHAGFEILHEEEGQFNNYAAAMEERFVCQKV